jgi:hypothetical protein
MAADDVKLLTTWEPVPLDKLGELAGILATLAVPHRAHCVSCREAGDGSVEYFIRREDMP